MKPTRKIVVLDALLVTQKPTGVGRSILELTAAMCQQDWGLDFVVLVTETEPFAFLDGIHHWRVIPCAEARGGTLRKALFTQWNIPRICRKLGADLLHCLQFVSPLILPCPAVVTVHDLAWKGFPDTVEQPRRSYYRLMVPGSLARAATVVTNSEATAREVRKHYGGLKNVVVTPFGTPSWVWEPGGPESVQPGRPKNERPFFLFVGTLEPRKNLEGIVRAYGDLLAREKPPGLGKWPALTLVGGRGWRDSKLRRLMDPLIASQDLVVLDYCDTSVLKDLYRRAQALLFPSLHEGFGFPILEAMAFGLPVLTSDRGAMAEVAGTNALLVDPENRQDLCEQLFQLATSPQLREKLGAEGPKWARNWTWQVTAEKTVEVYRRLLGP